MFSDEDHTLITLEKKIERLTKSVDSIGSKKPYWHQQEEKYKEDDEQKIDTILSNTNKPKFRR